MAHDGEASTGAWLTTGQATRAAGVHRFTVYQWIARRHLPARPTEVGFLVAAEDLARYRAAATIGVRVGPLRYWSEEAEDCGG
jgi:hypothetical protein